LPKSSLYELFDLPMTRFFFSIIAVYFGFAGPAWGDSTSRSPVEYTADLPKMIDECSGRLGDFTSPAQQKPPGGDPAAAMSKASAEVINSRDLKLLERFADTAQMLLDDKVSCHIWRVNLFEGSARREESQRLRQTLGQVESFFVPLNESCQEIRRYLENYPQQDWEAQFGQTGFYDHLCRVERDLILIRAAFAFYQAAAVYDITDSPTQSAGDKNARMKLLLNSFDELRDLKPQWSKTGDAIQLLWQLRLAGMLAVYDGRYRDGAKKLSASVPSKFTSLDYEFQFRLESLLSKNITPDCDRVKLEAEITELEKWLLGVEDRSAKLPSYLLQLTSLRSSLCRRDSQAGDASPGIIPNHALIRRRLKAFRALPRIYPPLENTVHLLAGEALVETFENPQAQAVDYPWDDFELIALGEWLQSRTPPQYDQAAKAYDLFLARETANHPYYPCVLYQKGLCHYQQSQSQTDAASRRHALAALQCWERLGREFPGWQLQKPNQTISSEFAMSQAAVLAYQVSVTDEADASLRIAAHQALNTLVGAISAEKPEPVGIYANSPVARNYRYYYGLSLLAAKEYKQAQNYFNVVPAENSRKFAARYYAVLSGTLMNNQAESSRRLSISELTDLLTSLAPMAAAQSNSENTQIAVKALALAGRLCLENQPPEATEFLKLQDQYLALLNPDVLDAAQRWDLIVLRAKALLLAGQPGRGVEFLAEQVIPSGLPPTTVSAATSLLQAQRDEMLALHAGDERQKLQFRLSRSILLAEAVQEALISAGDRSGLQAAIPLILELYALAAITPEDSQAQSLPARPEILAKAKALVQSIPADSDLCRAMGYVRCRALLALGKADYEESQKLFYQIRQAADSHPDDPQQRYYWWESRYYGLYCLFQQGQIDQARHIAEVLQKTYPAGQSPWQQRIEQCVLRFCPQAESIR
jgi:hypothetical protein